MIKVSDLRKGNLIKTEYGILKVHNVAFNNVLVSGNDGRILWAKEVEGVGIGAIHVKNIDSESLTKVLRKWLFVHELQNWYYWHNKKELNINA